MTVSVTGRCPSGRCDARDGASVCRARARVPPDLGVTPSFGWKRRSTALTRSTTSRCEKGATVAPILRPTASISSSLDEEEMACRTLAHAAQTPSVHARYLDIET